jgi:hypothetical protein
MKRIMLILITVLLWSAIATYAGDVSVTVYNSNLGVVHETRELEFDKGTGRISFVDVPTMIDATSVGFEIVDKSKSVVILEQNYAYDLVSPNKIYSKYIDKNIDLFDKEGNSYRGTLLSFAENAFVIKDASGGIKVVRTDQVTNANFPELPEGLITRPTLFWLYNSDFSGKADCKVSYQTSGISWTAEYVGILSEDEKNLNLTGWSSINNRSGASYTDATLKLIAGDIHRARKMVRGGFDEQAIELMTAKGPAPGFEEKEFFEYHLYTLPRKATIANNEIKQIALFEPAATTVDKKFYFQPHLNNKKVKVVIEFKNSQDAGLGMPLPAGRARLFKADTDGSMILLGEDNIDHTPKDEEVKLTAGYAFDISAEEKVLDYQRISDKVFEQVFEIEIRNHKSDDITVNIEKKLYGDWEIIKSNFEYNKKDANTLEYEIPVESDGKTSVIFTVRTTR